MGPDQVEEDEKPHALPHLNRMWIACFSGRKEKVYWWDKFLDPSFRHCFMLQYQSETYTWVMVDWRSGVCDVVVMNPDEVKYIMAYLKERHGTAVLFKGNSPERDILYRFQIVYCVQACLQIMGLPSGWTITPKQLYNRLINNGGEELVNFRYE